MCLLSEISICVVLTEMNQSGIYRLFRQTTKLIDTCGYIVDLLNWIGTFENFCIPGKIKTSGHSINIHLLNHTSNFEAFGSDTITLFADVVFRTLRSRTTCHAVFNLAQKKIIIRICGYEHVLNEIQGKSKVAVRQGKAFFVRVDTDELFD